MTEQRMSAQEAVALCRMAKAACPQQQFDEYTPDMWHELLGDLRFQDARDALVVVVKRQPFVSPAEIRDAVANVRRDRILAFGYLRPPVELDDNWGAQQRWMRETKRRIGDGEIKPGDQLEPWAELLERVMPEWESFLPSPGPVTRALLAAETQRTKSPDHERKLADARAELDNHPARREFAMPAAKDDVDALRAALPPGPPMREPVESEAAE